MLTYCGLTESRADKLGGTVVDAPKLKRRLGAKLLLRRAQEYEWSRSRAAREAVVDEGTVKRIELGQNYKIDGLIAYAKALGRPIDELLWEVLVELRDEPPTGVGESKKRVAG